MPCGTTGTTCSKSVIILLGETKLVLAAGNITATSANKSCSMIRYKQRNIGMYLVIDAENGLTVLWDRKTAVRIILQPQHMGEVCGLCGNFNEDGKDDFTTQSNLQTTNVIEFANSWKTSSSCPNAEGDFDTCIETPKRQTWAKLQCSIITSDTFKDCHAVVDPGPYYENCVKDTCSCDTGGDCECFCTAVAAYAQACDEAGVCVNWRTPEICPVYCDYYNNNTECIWHYHPCHPPCYKTCLNPDGICNNTLPNLEGCYPKCPEDKPIFDEKNRVCVEKCIMCYVNGTAHYPGELIPVCYDPCYECICDNLGNTQCYLKPECISTTTTIVTTTSEMTERSTPSITTPLTTSTIMTTTTGTPTTPVQPSTPPSSTTPLTTTTKTTKVSTEITSSGSTTETINPVTKPTATVTQGGQESPTMSTPSSTLSIMSTPSSTLPSPTTPPSTTLCFCVFNGTQYRPGETIFSKLPIGPGICLTIICSDICAFKNWTESCPTPPPPTTTTPITSTGPSTTPPVGCPEWDKNTNETFHLCDCYMARCIKDNIIEVFPFKCPPPQKITCANGLEPVLVYDEHHCCQHYACDCYCEGWGDPHYITFDGLYYSYQGNCTYVLMEETNPKHNLKIYIDNVFCDPIEHVSCPRSIIVSYNNQIITLTNHNVMGGADLEARWDNDKLKLPFVRNGVRVVRTSLNLILEISMLRVNVTIGITGFSVSMPYEFFGKNTQGHCGTCNNNQKDDCMLPGGILKDDCVVVADYWIATDRVSEGCSPPTALPTVSSSPKPTEKPCNALPDCNLLNSDLFKECHAKLSPVHYFSGCQYDSCHMSNPAVVCTSLQTYASACSQLGICINWRNYTNLCNFKCPGDKVFKPCGPAETPTCEDVYVLPSRLFFRSEEDTITLLTEGCFCPEGTRLFNKESGLCVDKCGCLDASGTPHEFGDAFEYNCEACVCEESSKSVTCKPKQCSGSIPAKCTEPGYVLVNVTNPSDPCCNKETCSCDAKLCPPTNNTCDVGYTPQLLVPGKCCPQIKCIPKKVCVHKNKEYEPGSALPVVDCQECTCTWDVDPKTQFFKIMCKSVQCKQQCDLGYKYVDDFSSCCGKCEQTHCIVNTTGTTQILKEGDDLTTDKGCGRISCTKVNGQFITNTYKIQCLPFNVSNCQPGTVQLSADGCCDVCVDKNKGCRVQTVEDYISHNGCQSVSKVNLTYCEGDCVSYSKYSQPGSSTCGCCQAAQTRNRIAYLKCINKAITVYNYVHVEQCACGTKDCHETGEDLIQQIYRKRFRKKRSFP